MGRALTQARYGSGNAVLAPRWMVATVLHRNPELISRHCTPLACDVHSRALLYDVDEAETVLRKVSRWPADRLKKLASC